MDNRKIANKKRLNGKTYEEIYGEKKANDIRKKISKAQEGAKRSKKSIENMRKAQRKRFLNGGIKMIIKPEELQERRNKGETIISIAKEYELKPSSLYSYAHRNNIYMSVSTIINVNCEYCGVLFRGRKEYRRPNKKHFCCKEHYSAWQHENLRLGNSPGYIDGRYKDKDHRAYRKSNEYREWRKYVFMRDDWTCLICGERGGNIQAHHILPQSDYPELIYVVENGATVCWDCHVHKVNHHEYEWCDYFLEAQNYAVLV